MTCRAKITVDKIEETSEQAMSEILSEILLDINDERILGVVSFEDVGLLTMNKGIIIMLSDGSEFQITIIRR
jgi:hypothetical protein